jgi:hypothetical protein
MSVGGMRMGGMRMGGMRMGGMRVGCMGVMRVMGVMKMDKEAPVPSWGVLVSSPLNGCRGGILADAWVAYDSALGGGDQREGDCDCQHLSPTAARTRWAPANLCNRASRDDGVSVIKGAVAAMATSAVDVRTVLPTAPVRMALQSQ